MRILLVEDEPVIAQAAVEALKEAGHEVVGPCSSLEEALRAAAAERPELAFVDVDLGGRNEGLDVARRLKSEHGIQAVFATGQAELARNHQGSALGVIRKPYDDATLQRAIPVLQAVMAGQSPPPPIPDALELF